MKILKLLLNIYKLILIYSSNALYGWFLGSIIKMDKNNESKKQKYNTGVKIWKSNIHHHLYKIKAIGMIPQLESKPFFLDKEKVKFQILVQRRVRI